MLTLANLPATRHRCSHLPVAPEFGRALVFLRTQRVDLLVVYVGWNPHVHRDMK
jgi:hypothetical protein